MMYAIEADATRTRKIYNSAKSSSLDSSNLFTGLVATTLNGTPAFHINGGLNAIVRAYATDSLNNFYVSYMVDASNSLASFNDSTTSDNATKLYYRSPANTDNCIVKYSKDGTFQHMVFASVNNMDNRCLGDNAICTDASNNIYCTTTENQSISPRAVFVSDGPISRNATSVTIKQLADIGPGQSVNSYVVKWDPSGNFDSAAYLPAPGSDFVYAIAFSETNKCLYVGDSFKANEQTIINFRGFGNPPEGIEARNFPTNTVAIILRLKESGSSTSQPVVCIGRNTASSWYTITSISIDASSNVYATCAVSGAMIQVSTAVANDSATPVFEIGVSNQETATPAYMQTLIKFNANLNFLWMTTVETGTLNDPSTEVYDTVSTLARSPDSLCCATTTALYMLVYSTTNFRIARKYIKADTPTAITSKVDPSGSTNAASITIETTGATTFACLVKYTFDGIYQEHVLFKATVLGSKIRSMKTVNDNVYVSFAFNGTFSAGSVTVGSDTPDPASDGTVLLNATDLSNMTLVSYTDIK